MENFKNRIFIVYKAKILGAFKSFEELVEIETIRIQDDM